MMNYDPVLANSLAQGVDRPRGINLASVILPAVWIVITTAVSQAALWIVEQLIIEGSFRVPDIRWLISISYGIALVVPFLLLWVLSRDPQKRARYRTFFLASILPLLFSPARFFLVTASQEAALYKTLMLALVWGGIIFWSRRHFAGSQGEGRAQLGTQTGVFYALLAGGASIFPWAVWGALGSPLDVLVAGAEGLLAGGCACLILYQSLFRRTWQENPRYGRVGWFEDSLVTYLVFLIVAAATVQNGNEWILVSLFPLCALGTVGLSRAAFVRDSRNPWLPAMIFSGLTATWPLMWIDPDELNILSAAGKGELIEWAGRATLASGALVLIVTFLLFIFKKSMEDGFLSRRVIKISAILLWVALFAGLHFGRGTPGFYGEQLFVILRDQADVFQASQIDDLTARRQYVYDALTSHAKTSQRPLWDILDRWGIEYQPFYLVNSLEVNGGPLLKIWLKSRLEVDRVLDNPRLRPLPAAIPIAEGLEPPPESLLWNLKMIHADPVWEMGITGKGIVIGQSDSGVQGDHPELRDSYRGKDGDDDYNWFDPWNHTGRPVDIGGHGTHTLGVVLGNKVGVAPDAEWIGCVNLARNLGNPAVYLQCWQFMLAPFPQRGDPLQDGKVELGANILNNSWGCPAFEGCDPTTYLPAVEALKAAGVFAVVSAGNSGYSGCGSVEDPPAIYKDAYSVGAVTSDGYLAEFSSLGPVMVDGSNRIKPDILAPGQGVLSAYPGNTYEVASGTSMAGPHVAGVVALMWSANPSLIGDIERTTMILNQTAQPYPNDLPECVGDKNVIPNNGAGYGIVDAWKAVEQALANR